MIDESKRQQLLELFKRKEPIWRTEIILSEGRSRCLGPQNSG